MCTTLRTCSKGLSIRNPICLSKHTVQGRPGNPVLEGCPSQLNKIVWTGERLQCAPLRRIRERVKKQTNKEERRRLQLMNHIGFYSAPTECIHCT